MQCKTTDSRRFYPDVQTALAESFTSPIDSNFVESLCSRPGCGAQWGYTVQEVRQSPQVLLLQLQRWESEWTPAGLLYRRIPSCMSINDSITLGGARLQLKAVIFHQGVTPNGGHYVAVAKHGNGSNSFFLYNDALRREADSFQHNVCTEFPPAGEFHAAALLYERASS